MPFTMTEGSGTTYTFTEVDYATQGIPGVGCVYVYYNGTRATYIGQTNDLNRCHGEHMSGASASDFCIGGDARSLGYCRVAAHQRHAAERDLKQNYSEAC